MDKTSLGDRMKAYEQTTRSFLMRRTPVIVRVDGKAFHTFTRQLDDVTNTPFSDVMHEAMLRTALYTHFKIQNCVFSYTQSDEISFLLKDWNTLDTQQWFNSNIQKIATVSASIATAGFNFFFGRLYGQRLSREFPSCAEELAHFDARVFNIPMEEVVNYFIWRQQDATRNSVQMLGRHYFSHKQLHGLNRSQIQDKLWTEHNVNWNDLPTWCKRGSSTVDGNPYSSSDPILTDEEIPIFTADRNYIEKQLEETDEICEPKRQI